MAKTPPQPIVVGRPRAPAARREPAVYAGVTYDSGRCTVRASRVTCCGCIHLVSRGRRAAAKVASRLLWRSSRLLALPREGHATRAAMTPARRSQWSLVYAKWVKNPRCHRRIVHTAPPPCRPPRREAAPLWLDSAALFSAPIPSIPASSLHRGHIGNRRGSRTGAKRKPYK